MTKWENFKANRESQFEKIREKMKEYDTDYWTEVLNAVRESFGFKPTTEGKIRKDVLNKKKTSEPVAKKRD